MVTPVLSQKEVKVFKNVSFDPRAIALWHETQGRFYRLKFFYLVLFIFIKSLFLAKKYISKVHFQQCKKYFYSREILNIRLGWSLITVILDFKVILNEVFWAVV